MFPQSHFPAVEQKFRRSGFRFQGNENPAVARIDEGNLAGLYLFVNQFRNLNIQLSSLCSGNLRRDRDKAAMVFSGPGDDFSLFFSQNRSKRAFPGTLFTESDFGLMGMPGGGKGFAVYFQNAFIRIIGKRQPERI